MTVRFEVFGSLPAGPKPQLLSSLRPVPPVVKVTSFRPRNFIITHLIKYNIQLRNLYCDMYPTNWPSRALFALQRGPN